VDPNVARIEEQFRQVRARLGEPGLSPEELQSLGREFKRLEPAAAAVARLRKVDADLAAARSLLSGTDPDMRRLAEEETAALEKERTALLSSLNDCLIPRDPRDDRDVIVEIRAGAGGEEAALFAGELYRMYLRYAQGERFTLESFDGSPTGLGGYKEVIFGVRGAGAYRRFKYESGVHRVQRVPATEASGRVHTSTVTVAVMPEADAFEVVINPKDLRIDVYRASGAGGQHVNKTESAVRMTHLPTGIVVACQDERSQMKNRVKAMAMLRARIAQREEDRRAAERRDFRRTQVGAGERNEKIRTYNYPQDRVTDHRLNQNFHNLPAVLEGGMGDIVAALLAREKSQKLAGLGNDPSLYEEKR
jgi:peptide chain release factor 1